VRTRDRKKLFTRPILFVTTTNHTLPLLEFIIKHEKTSPTQTCEQQKKNLCSAKKIKKKGVFQQ
jgi:hypothetical protein